MDSSSPPALLDDAAQVAKYLDEGVLLAMTARLGPDVIDPTRRYAIQTGIRGDDVMTWPISCTDYLRRYGYDPTNTLTLELLDHVRGRQYRMPDLSEDQKAAIVKRFKASVRLLENESSTVTFE